MKIALSPVTAVCCDAAFQVIENAAIHIEDSRISYVGPSEGAPPFEADETLGGPHLVAMPGLINTHTHAAMTLLRGYADDLPLEVWLQTKIWPFEANLQSDDVYWGTLLACAEMIRGGTTTFGPIICPRGLSGRPHSSPRLLSTALPPSPRVRITRQSSPSISSVSTRHYSWNPFVTN